MGRGHGKENKKEHNQEREGMRMTEKQQEKERGRQEWMDGEGEGAWGERRRAFISDSNRADRQHPGGQQAQSREQPRQTKGLFKLGELP